MPTTKKPSPSKPGPSKAKPKAKPAPSRLQNLAARPSFDEAIDEQLVDHSGVFRVTSDIVKAQTGHDEEPARFPNDSLVMAAQRDGFPEEPTIDEGLEDRVVLDETATVEKRQRLATLAARAQSRARSKR